METEKIKAKRGKGYSCVRCGDVREKKAAINHIIQKHLGSDLVPFLCQICGYRAMDRDSFTKHLQQRQHKAIVRKNPVTAVLSSDSFCRQGPPFTPVITRDKSEKKADLLELSTQESKLVWLERKAKDLECDGSQQAITPSENKENVERKVSGRQPDDGEIVGMTTVLKNLGHHISPGSKVQIKSILAQAETNAATATLTSINKNESKGCLDKQERSNQEVQGSKEELVLTVKGITPGQCGKEQVQNTQVNEDLQLSESSDSDCDTTSSEAGDGVEQLYCDESPQQGQDEKTTSTQIHESTIPVTKEQDEKTKNDGAENKMLQDAVKRGLTPDGEKRKSSDGMLETKSPKRLKGLSDTEIYGEIEIDDLRDMDLDEDMKSKGEPKHHSVATDMKSIGKVVRSCIGAISSALTAKIRNCPAPLEAALTGVTNGLNRTNASLAGLTTLLHNNFTSRDDRNRPTTNEMRSIARNMENLRSDVSNASEQCITSIRSLTAVLHEFTVKTSELKSAVHSIAGQLETHNNIITKTMQAQTKEFRRLNSTVTGLNENIMQGGKPSQLVREIIGIDNSSTNNKRRDDQSYTNTESYYTNSRSHQYDRHHVRRY